MTDPKQTNQRSLVFLVIFVLLMCGIITREQPAEAPQGDPDRWTDTQLCIDSYDGLIDYNIAVEGCKSRTLQGLSHEEQMGIQKN